MRGPPAQTQWKEARPRLALRECGGIFFFVFYLVLDTHLVWHWWPLVVVTLFAQNVVLIDAGRFLMELLQYCLSCVPPPPLYVFYQRGRCWTKRRNALVECMFALPAICMFVLPWACWM